MHYAANFCSLSDFCLDFNCIYSSSCVFAYFNSTISSCIFCFSNYRFFTFCSRRGNLLSCVLETVGRFSLNGLVEAVACCLLSD